MTDIQYDLQYITTDVTSVKFIGKWIIAGIGGCIHIYETNSKKLVARRKIFEKQRVHNILYKQDKYLGIIGGKVVHIFNFFKSDDFSISKQAAFTQNDWVHNLQWLENETVALITGHNAISLWSITTGEKIKNVYCEVKSILYSALMYGDLWSNLIAFSGTVFKQILIWAPANIEDDSKDSPVLHTLKGHNGVIHSVSYDPPSQIICSTSDDRSVRIWGVDIQTSGNSDHVAQWRDANITLLHSVYGHTARVWKNVIANNCVVSAGEDSRLCFWNFDGILLKSWKTHQNGSVWSLDFNREENVIVTGGSDGGICLWPLHKDQLLSFPLHYEETLFERSMKNTRRGNFPKRIGMTKKGNIVAVTDSGYLLYCKVTNDMQGEWDIVYEEEKLTNYCLMEISPCRQYIATANINGYILIFTEFDSSEEDKLILQLEKKVVEGRIFSLHWLSSERLAICGPDGVIEVWELRLPDSLEKSNEFELPKSKERWITAVSVNETFLACGDRMGSIHLFKLDDSLSSTLQGPVQSFYKIHGHLGVCCLGWYGNRLYSTGRDGTLRSFLLLEAECRLKPLNADRLCIEWPAALCQSDYGLLVLGFKSVNLLIWSHTERRILLRMPCGGGHRSWDWILNGKVFTFIYVKDKMIHMFVLKLDNIVQPIIKLGFHTTEIMCMKQLRLIEGDNDCHVFLSASEDTTVRLAVVDDSSVLKPLAVLQSHISSVRALATCLLKDGVLVFSGGGRAQLKVWKFVVVSVEENVPEITCEELFSHMLIDPNKRNKKPWLSTEHNSDPETRYMDLSALMIKSENIGEDALVFLAAACSDGFLRIFYFSLADNSFELIGKYYFHNRCILKVSLMVNHGRYAVMTMATDGKVAFWDITRCVVEIIQVRHKSEAPSERDSNISVDEKLVPFTYFSVHQSGINSFDWLELETDIILLATGGDDCALVLNAIRIIPSTVEDELKAEVVSSWRKNGAHFSQITGLKFINGLLVSTGIDQRIAVWSWTYDHVNDTISVLHKKKYFSTIPDIQGLLTWNYRNNIRGCVHGQGLEIFEIHLEEGS